MNVFAFIFASVGIIAMSVAMNVVLGLIMAIPVMLLWNWLIPSIFGWAAISYWQAWGLMVLSGMLVKTSVNTSSK